MALSLEKIRDRYYEHAKQASELTRTLAISGIAAVWVFAERDGSIYRLDRSSLLAGGLFCIGLLADLLHYVVGTMLFSRFATRKEEEQVSEALIPKSITRAMYAFWWVKVSLVILGFVVLSFGLAQRLIANAGAASSSAPWY